MKVTDEDLELLMTLEEGGTGRLFNTERLALNYALDELLRLRKVADMAAAHMDWCGEVGGYDLLDALKGVGR